MAAIAVRTARLHEAEEQWTIHAERDRIARELHDSLAQVLGVIHLQLRSLEARAKDEASLGIADELSALAETADEAYSDVREAILGLRETVREDDGLEGSLREYLRKYSRQTGIAATLTCEGDTRRALSPRSEVQLLRVVQEALTNARKHADATRVAVRIDCLERGHHAHDRGRWRRLRPHRPSSARWKAASAWPPCASGSSRSAARSTCILRRPRGRGSSSDSTQRTRVGTHVPEAPGAARR